MRFSTSIILAFLSATGYAQDAACVADPATGTPPMISPLLMKNGAVLEPDADVVKMYDVVGCCGIETCENDERVFKTTVIGKMPQMTEEQALDVLMNAKGAWDGGAGAWPQMSIGERIKAVQNFIMELKSSREAIIDVLMWEIGKNKNDATAEYDRTIQFIDTMIAEVKKDPEFNSDWETIGSTRAFVRRTAIGIIMCLGPYNYPLNETWAMAFAALLAGNVLVLKIPTVGGLCHLLTMDAFSKAFPPGTINFVSGSGRVTMPPMMKSGLIDGLGFIGGSKAADDLIRQHPHPHRLKLFLQLEAKNMAIFLEDMFEPQNSSGLDSALNEAVTGSLSFNGQRCTALKMLFVPSSFAEIFVEKFVAMVEESSIGLPWDSFKDGGFPKITPLPNQQRIKYMKQLIEDAVSKGAKVMNKNGGTIIGGEESTLMVPAVLYPVTKEMKLYHEEQFGPVIPIIPYDNIDPVLQNGRNGEYGQQVSIFTAGGSSSVATEIVDKFSAVFGKININSQCGRSPDTLPFSGRRSSAMGIMSAKYAIREFSVPTVVAYKENKGTSQIVQKIEKGSNFMEKL